MTPAGSAQVYDMNMTNAHTFIAGGVVTHNCNLASLALPTYVIDKETYDFKRLHEVIELEVNQY